MKHNKKHPDTVIGFSDEGLKETEEITTQMSDAIVTIYDMFDGNNAEVYLIKKT